MSQLKRLWLAAYTRPRHETSVAAQLGQKKISLLLPLYRKYSRWSDRVQHINTPLFPGYVFVQVDEADRIQVLRTNGVIKIVSSGGRPSPIAEEDVAVLRACVARPSDVEPYPYLKEGHRVRIRCGPFAGWEGVLVQKQNSARVVVRIQQIMQAVAITIHLADIEAAS